MTFERGGKGEKSGGETIWQDIACGGKRFDLSALGLGGAEGLTHP